MIGDCSNGHQWPHLRSNLWRLLRHEVSLTYRGTLISTEEQGKLQLSHLVARATRSIHTNQTEFDLRGRRIASKIAALQCIAENFAENLGKFLLENHFESSWTSTPDPRCMGMPSRHHREGAGMMDHRFTVQKKWGYCDFGSTKKNPIQTSNTNQIQSLYWGTQF